MRSPLAGTALLARMALRTGWRPAVIWVLGLTALYLATGLSIEELYDTPAKLATYSAPLGDAMVMITGRIVGLDTLGGVIMNEFSSIVTFAIPVMAIALTTAATRKEEESGRSELVLSARIGRLAPLAAALVVVVGIFLTLGLALWAVTFTLDIDRTGAAYYAASIAATGAVYAAGTALVAQLVAHNRTVWSATLALAGLTLITRGIGDARENALSWTSPLGWYGLVRPFGDPDAVPLILAVVVAGLLGAAALWLCGRRDVGAGLLPSRPGAARATRWRASRPGQAVHQHLGAFLGWTIGVVALMSLYGGLMNVVLETITANPDLAVFVGDTDVLVDSVVQMLVAFAGFLGAAFALQALNGLRGEETSGRLEQELAGGRSRTSWLAAHALVVVLATMVVVTVGVLAFAAGTEVVLGGRGQFGGIVAAGLWQVPAALVFVGLAVGLFGLAPRWQPLAWGVFAVAVVVTFMGPTLRLTDAQMRLSPFGAVGQAPIGPVSVGGVTLLVVITLVTVAGGLIGFRGRDVPRT